MASSSKGLPTVLVYVEDPDTIRHGTGTFKRVANVERIVHDDGSQSCGACYTRLEGWYVYCPHCGGRLKNAGGGLK